MAWFEKATNNQLKFTHTTGWKQQHKIKNKVYDTTI
jgi:hypothetical protein